MRAPALLLGFALGGFLDGIVLHQLLQWHHLLSGWAPGEALPFHVLWDGVFHAAHGALALAALVLLWRRRRAAEAAGAGRRLAGWAWIGFGAWHGLDVALNHWVLGMHRTRMDVADPLPWDLGLLAVGLVGALLGLALLRRPGGGPGRGMAAGLAAAVLAAAPLAALPPPAPDPALAALRAGLPLPAFCLGWTRLSGRTGDGDG